MISLALHLKKKNDFLFAFFYYRFDHENINNRLKSRISLNSITNSYLSLLIYERKRKNKDIDIRKHLKTSFDLKVHKIAQSAL